MLSRAQFALQVLLLTAALCLGVARTGHALNLTLTGQINATFDNVLTEGDVTNGGHFNNQTTAVFTAGTNTFTWGARANEPIPSSSFTWVPIAGKFNTCNPSPCTSIPFGTFEYLNGTSDLDTLVFGVTMHLNPALTFPNGDPVPS